MCGLPSAHLCRPQDRQSDWQEYQERANRCRAEEQKGRSRVCPPH
ncbi:hypothetical protein Aam_022_015 [Acidocella aminolytica 101 = DSM 11237]|uniref:Uncharacterized protein n=1 Tax=Acidocella aminolytica 101 = DSM 11237 TaxID=1120923 RepID=A0A0D6PE92_9PROT|nr:hypothetical protein Aam_022_015 [Acidocella aminolytica 101 = DSM 11237]